jgi:hypothetical protein
VRCVILGKIADPVSGHAMHLFRSAFLTSHDPRLSTMPRQGVDALARVVDVAFWHEADVPAEEPNVCF